LEGWIDRPDILQEILESFERSTYRYPADNVGNSSECDALNYKFDFSVVNNSTSTIQFDLKTVKLVFTNSVCQADESDYEIVTLEPNMTFSRKDSKVIEFYLHWEIRKYVLLKCGEVPNSSIQVTCEPDYSITIK